MDGSGDGQLGLPPLGGPVDTTPRDVCSLAEPDDALDREWDALALAIGANTAAFTFLRSVYQEPPYVNASQLVVIRSVDPRQRNMTPDQRTMNVSTMGVSYQDFADWKRSAKSFSHVVISSEQPMNIADEGLAPERYFGSYTSANVFQMLGLRPVLGRDFTANAPDRVWLADLTYIWTAEGWLYVAAVVDLFSRRVVGWSMSATMTAQLVTDALVMAIWRRGRPPQISIRSAASSRSSSPCSCLRHR